MKIEISIGPKSHVILLLDHFFHLHHSPNDPISTCEVICVLQQYD